MPCKCIATLVCPQCGTSFVTNPHRRPNARCCSQSCGVKYAKAESPAQTAARFWSHVDTSGECWPWTGGRDKDGYGKFFANGRHWRATRFAYFLAHGREPVGLLLCHTCDNPPCVRPDHLFPGTHATNHADRNAKSRQAKGERMGMARLTDSQAREIRALYAAGGITQKTLATQFGVCPATISHVTSGRYWRHL